MGQNYLYIQEMILSVIFNTFQSIVNCSVNTTFNFNLACALWRLSYELMRGRNAMPTIQVRAQVEHDNAPTTDSVLKLNGTLLLSAALVDRVFTYFLSAAYFLGGATSIEEFWCVTERVLGESRQAVMT